MNYLTDPLYLPVSDEQVDPVPMRIRGEIPAEISGSYFRNGPNPHHRDYSHHHWFDGDGMIQKVRLHAGRASYQRRYVRTRGLRVEKRAGSRVFAGLSDLQHASTLGAALKLGRARMYGEKVLKDTSNSDLVHFNGQLLSLWWLSGKPYVINPETLETEGVSNFNGTYTGTMAAHARVDRKSNDLFFIEFKKTRPYLRAHRVSADGRCVWSTRISVPTIRIYHDILFTDNHVLIMDFPFGVVRAKRSLGMSIGMDLRYPSRVHLLRRSDGVLVRTFSFDPTYVLHGINAYETATSIEMIVCKYLDPRATAANAHPDLPLVGALRVETRNVHWRFDLLTGAFSESSIDETNTEFPVQNPQLLGSPSRTWYSPIVKKSQTLQFSGLLKYKDGLPAEQIRLKPHEVCEEPIYIAKESAVSEDDGFIGVNVHNMAERSTVFRIYHAQHLDQEPLAEVEYPEAIPHGFHAEWVAQRGSESFS